MDYGKYLKTLREAKGINRRQLAMRCRMAESTIRNWEDHGFVPTISNFAQVLEGLGKRLEIVDIENIGGEETCRRV